MRNNISIANIFNGNQDISLEERNRVIKEISKKTKGVLNFRIKKGREGWLAECKEMPAVLACGNSPKPTSVEIEDGIRDAIYSVFNVKFNQKVNKTFAPLQFKYSLK